MPYNFALKTQHLAPKHIANSTKTHCNQHQNAVRFAPKYGSISTKTQRNLVLIAIKVPTKHAQLCTEMQKYDHNKAECDWLEMAKKIENAGSTWGKRTEKAPFGPLKADNRD